MQPGRGVGRGQDGKRKAFYNILRFREEEAEIFF